MSKIRLRKTPVKPDTDMKRRFPNASGLTETLPGQTRSERNREIRERYADGESQASLADAFHIPARVVRHICKGVERKPKPPPQLPPEILARNEEMRRRYAEGEAAQRLVDDYHVSITTVYGICADVERKKVPRTGYAPSPELRERNEKIRERWANGATVNEIADDYGLAAAGIYKICRGVKRKVAPKAGRNAEIRERFANGESDVDLSREYDLALGYLIRLCKGVERKQG